MIILADALEQHPWEFSRPVKRVRFAPPDTGDYSVEGLERILRIEKKGCEELWQCLGSKREHFRGQLARMVQFPIRLLVIEGTLEDFSKRPLRSRLTWRAASSLLAHWTVEFGVPYWFLGRRSPATQTALEDLLVAIYDAYRREDKLIERWKSLVPGGLV